MSKKFFDTSLDTRRCDIHSYCTAIELQRFVSFTKPWKCDVEISLFFPVHILKDANSGYESELEYPFAIEYSTRAPLVPKYVILIDIFHMELNNVRYHSVCIREDKLQFRDKINNAKLATKYFMAFVSTKQNLGKTFTLNSVKAYNKCKLDLNIPLNKWTNYVVDLGQAPQDNVFWNLPHRDFTMVGNNDIHGIMRKCEMTNIFEIYYKKVDNELFAAIMKAHILQTILDNFTYPISDPISLDPISDILVCTSSTGQLLSQRTETLVESQNYIEARAHPGFSVPLEALFHFNDISKSLVFGTLETLKPSALPYENLLNVFSPTVWIVSTTILTIGCIAICIILGKRRSGGLSKQLVALAMCLLEQGDPYSVKICKVSKLKLILGGVFAICIVLSNGYKSTNIDKIVATRKVLKYNSLSQLIEENFVIYTRFINVMHNLQSSPGSHSISRENNSILPTMSCSNDDCILSSDFAWVIATK